jgi:signal transduction histidine kinase
MNRLALSTKFILIFGLVLTLFGFISFAILYQAQTHLITQEMDALLESEALSLSSLVDTQQNGTIDFEMSPFFLKQYQQIKPIRFFRFIDPQSGKLWHESKNAPLIKCTAENIGKSNEFVSENLTYRIRTQIFHPELDFSATNAIKLKPPSLCMVLGIDEAPYRNLVLKTLASTVPTFFFLVIFLVSILLLLVKSVTSDLSKLTLALETADFGVAHEFPPLPVAKTLEVEAVVEKLTALHLQATDAYKEIWLFLGRAAHQLKTPVAAMQATLQVLLRKERSKDELLAGLADVELATSDLAALTKKLISSTRIAYQASPHQEPIELMSFFTEQVRAFQFLAQQHGCTIAIETNTNVSIEADRFLLAEIFGNLIENALIHSSRTQGGIVTISWRAIAKNIEIEVADQGLGFPNEVQEALFEPFVRGDERHTSGSGLGLSIAKKAVLLLGGNIHLNKTGPSGSTIVVSLPK